ncbi:hypothetical protein KA478_05245 [Patescibacteria group bacterium]|nr:hypothetical protein [Patescibacteria group bacterium]
MQKEDTIVSVNGIAVDTSTLPRILKDYIGKTFLLVISRNGDKQSLSVACPEDSCVLGVAL